MTDSSDYRRWFEHMARGCPPGRRQLRVRRAELTERRQAVDEISAVSA
jgi:hypothetical protein